MTEPMNQQSRLQACTFREQLPESAVRGTAGRMQSLVRQPRHIDDMDTPLTFKVQHAGEQRQGKEARFQIEDFRLQIENGCT